MLESTPEDTQERIFGYSFPRNCFNLVLHFFRNFDTAAVTNQKKLKDLPGYWFPGTVGRRGWFTRWQNRSNLNRPELLKSSENAVLGERNRSLILQKTYPTFDCMLADSRPNFLRQRNQVISFLQGTNLYAGREYDLFYLPNAVLLSFLDADLMVCFAAPHRGAAVVHNLKLQYVIVYSESFRCPSSLIPLHKLLAPVQSAKSTTRRCFRPC